MRSVRVAFLSSLLLPVLWTGTAFGSMPVQREAVPVVRQRQATVMHHAHSRRTTSKVMRQSQSATVTMAQSLSVSTNVGFLTAQQIAISGAGVAFVSGDFDGNGTKDLALVVLDNQGQASLSIRLGNGDGTFQAGVATPISFNASGDVLFAADLNGDQKDDIVIAHSGSSSGSVAVFLSNGNGTFAAPVTYPDSIPIVSALTVADVNGDGYKDIVLANGVGGLDSPVAPQVSTFFGNGDGTFRPQSSTPIPGMFSHAVFADVNNDGRLDLISASQVFLANSGGGYDAPLALANAPSGFSDDGMVAVDDLNGDHQLDIVIANTSANSVTVYLNNGDGTFRQGATNYVGVAPLFVSIADVSGDGIPDVVTANSGSADITVLVGNGDGTFNPASTGYVAGGSAWAKPVIADFNGDGRAEIIVPQFASDYEMGLAFLQGKGNGAFVAAQNFYAPMSLTASGPAYGVALASADFNGDGVPDFVLGNAGPSSVGVTVFLGNADGTLKPGVNYGSGGYMEFVVTGDFNGDGFQDIVSSDISSGAIYLFLGNGNGTFQPPQTFPLAGPATGIAAADFNKDGKLDLAVASGPSTLNILLNNGAGFGPATAYTLSSYGWEIAVGDLDGDGNVDLVVTQGGSNFVSVLKGNGDGSFTPLPDVDVISSFASGIAIGDLNGDGRPDLAVTVEDGTGGMGIVTLLGNGDGTFGTPTLLSSSTSSAAGNSSYPGEIRMVDLNRDGKLDLVYTNAGFGTAGVMYGKGDGTFAQPTEFLVGGYPYGIVLTDLNGDNAIDAVIANDGYSGVTTLLNTAGSRVTLSSSLNPANTSDMVTFTATVGAVFGANVPTGSVTFKDGSTILNTVAISGGQASFSTASLSSGTHVISAVYSGDSSFMGSSGFFTQLVNQASSPSAYYVLTANPPSATIHPGESASFNLTVTPMNGFSGVVNFDCGTLPSGLSCQFSPASVSITGGQPAAAQLVVTASATALAYSMPAQHPGQQLPLWATFTGVMFGMASLEGLSQKKRRAMMIGAAVVVLLVAMVLLTGCGGAPQSNITQPQVASRTVHVVATASTGAGHTSAQTLDVVLTLQQ